jgi:hypothetical protein
MNAAWKKCGTSGLPSLSDSSDLTDDASWAPTEIAPRKVSGRQITPVLRRGPAPSPFASSDLHLGERPPVSAQSPFAASAPSIAPVAAIISIRPERTVLMPNAPRLLAVAAAPQPRKKTSTARRSGGRQILIACLAGLATFAVIVGATVLVLQ